MEGNQKTERSSESSKARSGSHRDHQQLKDSAEEEVIQDKKHFTRPSSTKKHHVNSAPRIRAKSISTEGKKWKELERGAKVVVSTQILILKLILGIFTQWQVARILIERESEMLMGESGAGKRMTHSVEEVVMKGLEKGLVEMIWALGRAVTMFLREIMWMMVV
ncbi:Uncharacterized protein Rs2_46448 [Raphanus sativus]|nr:Uncharacterized protein Rs2_46448 [Raphanus sativus]